eukprot:s475_g33.t3
MFLPFATPASFWADSAVPASARQAPRRAAIEAPPTQRLVLDETSCSRSFNRTWLVLPVACGLRAGQRWRRAAKCRRHRLALQAATAESMAPVMSQWCPLLAEATEVRESRVGDGLGLFATRSFDEGDVICELTFDNTTIMKPNLDISNKLESGDFGALAFQILKASRSAQLQVRQFTCPPLGLSAKRLGFCPWSMAAGLLKCLSEEMVDQFGVALLRACFEGWVSCTKRRTGRTGRTGSQGESELRELRAEIARLRSELVESQRLSAFNEAKIKQLELQLATEQEWNFEAVRFCAHGTPHGASNVQPVASSVASPADGLLEQAIFERDQALVEREQLRLELTAMQLVSQSREEVPTPSSRLGSPSRSPRLARAQLAAVTRQLQDCCVGLEPTGTSTTISSSPRLPGPLGVRREKMSARHQVAVTLATELAFTILGSQAVLTAVIVVRNLAAFEHLRSCTSPPAQSDAVRKMTAVVVNRVMLSFPNIKSGAHVAGSGPWKDWFETGVSAPDTHPLKLLLNDPQLAKYIWSSTTCGGQMSGMALQARDDLEQLQGSATFEDWTDTLALVMSRSVIEDRDERPLLIIGLDLLQAAEDPVIKLELNYGKEGAVMGLGGQGPEKLLGIKVKAVEDIEAGMELTMAYLAKPHAGGYLERYGFVPNWLRGELAESAMQLSISPVDDEDDFLGVKESCLEDLGLTTAPLSFTFSLSDGILAPRETDEWERKSELEKMVQVLRFQTCGGTDSFLLDAVYIERFWYNCNFRLSRNNEILVCQQAMAECDRWLDRFDALEVSRGMKKPRKIAALAVFGACVVRGVWHQVQEYRRTADLMAAFDAGQDQHLSSKDDQVGRMFGRVDDEGDGFDDVELTRILSIVSGLPAVSERIKQAAQAGNSWLFDLVLCTVTGIGLYYIVGQSDVLEKRWLQSSFRGAVQFHRMQSKCSKLDRQLGDLSDERLSTRLEEVTEQQRAATDQLQAEVSKWQNAAEEAMKQANNVKSKMASMMTCIKGLDAFSGSGTKRFVEDGAQQGFCHRSNVGFCLDTITFGTIEEGKLLLFETSTRHKIGEGRDCAYRCKELETGEEFALKMYTMSNPSQRRSIMHDLYAQRLLLGKHPRIVSYKRVIESETNIFVLMELLAGRDLFDVVCARSLTEEQAQPLFLDLVEGLQHLHSNKVIHCDVKPENAMVLGDIDAGTAHLKLIDFGCSCFHEFVKESETRACVVYDRYMPPELAVSPGLAPSVATDMWRLGCTLYVMLVRSPPFHDDAQTRSGIELREQGKFYKTAAYEAFFGFSRSEFQLLSNTPRLSDEAKATTSDLLVKLLAGDPKERPDATSVLATGTSPDSPLARAADDIRRAERDLLQSVKLVFEQELDLIQIDDTIRYWADRAMDEAFPDRMSKNVQGY